MMHRKRSRTQNTLLVFSSAAFLLGWLLGSNQSGNAFIIQDMRGSSAVKRNESPFPMQHSEEHKKISFKTGKKLQVSSLTDTFTPFHRYMIELGEPSQKDFPDLPQLNTWIHYFEAYHNHFARFRSKKNLVFMEVGVQSGGKIPMLRKYFGPGLMYIGIDINPSTKIFETAKNDDFSVRIEIGDIADESFISLIKKKYPHVDIFLDDGGHTMQQQITAMKHMLPHVQPEGIYMCEDLGTSWLQSFGGVPYGSVANDEKFVRQTMVGLIHQTLDWLLGTAISGSGQSNTVFQELDDVADDIFGEAGGEQSSWWKVIPSQIKHIHYYNQLVVYEKGITYKAYPWKTIGRRIRYNDSGLRERVEWKTILHKLDIMFGDDLL